MARLTYEAVAEIATLLGSKRDWPSIKPLSSRWMEDIFEINRMEAEEQEENAANNDPDDW